MDWFTAAVVYIMLWWLVLFAVLPFGVRPEVDVDQRTGWRGAPAQPLMVRKMLITTAIAFGLWLAAMAVIRSDWLSFRAAALLLPDN